jgi:hypothetical protein
VSEIARPLLRLMLRVFAPALDAAVGRIEQHLMKWQLRSGVTEKL